jgi:DNA-binding NarL/FixJ family response regulator
MPAALTNGHDQGPDGARPIRVLVADDQTVVREGLALILSLSPGITVVGAAADGEEAVRLVGERGPDVVLMDLRMPRLDGIAATRHIIRAFPATRVVVLTTYADDASIFGALEAGALGYLTKGASAQEIQRAIHTVHAGEALLDPAVQGRVIRAALGHGAPPPRTAAPLPDDLTPREAEVLRLIAQGRNNHEIAARLVVTEATVKTHINNIFSKAGLRDRAQAVVYAITHGLAGEAGAGDDPG